MRRGITAVLCTAISLFSLSTRAADTIVVEAFVCNFNTGKTMADLEAATNYYTTERAKIASPALQTMVSRVWTPNLGNTPYDFVWFNSNLTYTAWGDMRKAYEASEVGAAIQARFITPRAKPATMIAQQGRIEIWSRVAGNSLFPVNSSTQSTSPNQSA